MYGERMVSTNDKSKQGVMSGVGIEPPGEHNEMSMNFVTATGTNLGEMRTFFMINSQMFISGCSCYKYFFVTPTRRVNKRLCVCLGGGGGGGTERPGEQNKLAPIREK